MPLCSTVAITTAAAVVTVEMSKGAAFLWCCSRQWQALTLSIPHSLLVPVPAAALRPVDGGGGREKLRPAGEGRGLSRRQGFCALRPVVHGGGCWRAPGARLWDGFHAGGPGAACQQVSSPSGPEEKSGLTFLCPALGLGGTHVGCKHPLETHDQHYCIAPLEVNMPAARDTGLVLLFSVTCFALFP